jgi:glycosyltransferase involved in cell wall biosynthesis
MHVLHINVTSHTGGAARAMRRLSGALQQKGHQSRILVGRSTNQSDPNIYLIWDEVKGYRSLPVSLKSRIGNQIEKYVGIHPWANNLNLRITDTELFKWADIIDMRNLFGGFFNLWSLPTISANKPVVWRLPDLWAVTGHCAYPYNCQRWTTGCYRCPLLTPVGRKRVEPPPTIWDGTSRVWKAKRNIYADSSLHVVVTTKWMRDQVSKSILGDALSVNVISNGVNLDVYQPVDKKDARDQLGLPPDGKILLWAGHRKGAYRKGFRFANTAMELLQAADPDQAMFITMGGQKRWNEPERLTNVKHFEFVADPAKQALIYAAADGFLCTTLADGQPQTALESIACGTPVIAFDVGPMPEEVIDGKTGFIVADQDPGAVLAVIESFLKNDDQVPYMAAECRKQALEKYDLKKQTNRYIRLYEDILVDHQG